MTIKIIPVARWNHGAQLAFFQQKLTEHYLAPDRPPRDCTPEERWASPPTFAVMKTGLKRALRLFDTLAEAEAFRLEQKAAEGADNRKFQVIQRPIEYRRCESYCRVAHVCQQLKREAEALPF